MNSRAPWIAVALLCQATNALANAEPSGLGDTSLPLWEVGVGVGGLAAPAYVGSAVTRRYLAPWPYFVYRGEHLKASRDGLGLGLLASQRISLELSASGALPVRSKGTAREGMPDLPLAVEAGAVLKMGLLDDGAGRLSLLLPVRHASGIGRGGIQDIGWIADPTLRWTRRADLLGHPVDWGLDLTTKFQDRRFNDFYYRVTPAQATTMRPAWRGSGGYAGSTLNTGFLGRSGPFGLGAFIGLTHLSGARFAESPLVERKMSVHGGLTIFWIGHQSSDRAPPLASTR